MRSTASVLHLDLDAFFASVEQRDKPSLRGKPVIVGGVGQRGVVSTCSYEARVFGVRSAMPMHEARRLCPHAAFLAGRFGAYRAASAIVMDTLRELSPLVEPLSLDEAYVDLLAAPTPHDLSPTGLSELAETLRATVRERTGGLTASVGIGSSRFIAKLASELGKPDGHHIVAPGTEEDLIAPMAVTAIPGVGPATAQRLTRLGITTISDLRAAGEAELIRELGRAAGTNLFALAYARDDRPIVAEREAKSVSVEDTFEHDERDPARLAAIIDRDSREVAARIRRNELFARTVTVKVKLPDFTTHARSRTLSGATDHPEAIAHIARELLAGLDIREGVRLLGVGVSGLTTVAQDELFGPDGQPLPELDGSDETVSEPVDTRTRRRPTTWLPGVDVVHDELGPGWVWGQGLGRVTVRFETAQSGPGPVRTLAADDPQLHMA